MVEEGRVAVSCPSHKVLLMLWTAKLIHKKECSAQDTLCGCEVVALDSRLCEHIEDHLNECATCLAELFEARKGWPGMPEVPPSEEDLGGNRRRRIEVIAPGRIK